MNYQLTIPLNSGVHRVNFEIPTGTIRGSIKAPPSKSITHRLLIIGALSGKEFLVHNPLFCADTQITIDGLKKLGFEIEQTRESLQFNGNRKNIEKSVKIFVGNSGTSARFLTAVAALQPVRCTITGSQRIQRRPMLPLINTLRHIGAEIEHQSGYLPLKISGGSLSGGKIMVDSCQSSQFLSAILLIAPFLSADSQIYHGDSIASKPYVEMTATLMRKSGISVEENTDHYKVISGQAYSAWAVDVEGDFSNGANFLAGAAITDGRLEITNLSNDSIQGDKIILEILSESGAKIEIQNSRVIVEGGEISGIDRNMRDYPDLVPITSVLALFAKGSSRLGNVANLRLKESDRLRAILENIRRMNGEAYINGDDLIIEPQRLRGNLLSSYNDHRMAMSFAIAGLKVLGVVIKDSECVNKSYPGFWDDFRRLVK
jgi:3-phosphoshikimate 1-carboxyvinyltransferase